MLTLELSYKGTTHTFVMPADEGTKKLVSLSFGNVPFDEIYIDGKDIKAQIVGSDNLESGHYPCLESVWLYEVDELAALLEKATENGNNALYAYFEAAGCPTRLDSLVDLCERIISGEIYLNENILDAQDLGEYFVDSWYFDVPERIKNYIDYEKLGNDAQSDLDGGLTSFGFLFYN